MYCVSVQHIHIAMIGENDLHATPTGPQSPGMAMVLATTPTLTWSVTLSFQHETLKS